MVENHTRDLLQMKAKETQLARSRNDAELTQAALAKAQRDLEALRSVTSHDASKDVEMWKVRAEKAEQRLMEREELDQSVLARLTDLEEFIRGLDGEGDAETVSRISSRCKELEEQNRRLLSQMDEYSAKLAGLEEVIIFKIHTYSRVRNDGQHLLFEMVIPIPRAPQPPSVLKTRKKTHMRKIENTRR